MRKQEVLTELNNHTKSTHVITCGQCCASHESDVNDAMDFAESMYNEGWRIIDQAPACPKCK